MKENFKALITSIKKGVWSFPFKIFSHLEVGILQITARWKLGSLRKQLRHRNSIGED